MSALPKLDLSPKGLFPSNLTAEQDPKCQIVARVILEIASRDNMYPYPSQQYAQADAREKYTFVDNPDLLQPDRVLFYQSELGRIGVTLQTARALIELRQENAVK